MKQAHRRRVRLLQHAVGLVFLIPDSIYIERHPLRWINAQHQEIMLLGKASLSFHLKLQCLHEMLFDPQGFCAGSKEVRESPKSEKSAESLVDGVVPSKIERLPADAPDTTPTTVEMMDLPRIRVHPTFPSLPPLF